MGHDKTYRTQQDKSVLRTQLIFCNSGLHEQLPAVQAHTKKIDGHQEVSIECPDCHVYSCMLFYCSFHCSLVWQSKLSSIKLS